MQPIAWGDALRESEFTRWVYQGLYGLEKEQKDDCMNIQYIQRQQRSTLFSERASQFLSMVTRKLKLILPLENKLPIFVLNGSVNVNYSFML